MSSEGPPVAPPGTTLHLATWAAGLRADDLPETVVRQAARLLVDTVGCLLGGHASRAGRIAVRWATEAANRITPGGPRAHGTALVVGTAACPPWALAAYANGRLAAVLDADETWPSTRQTAHLAAATVAAALGAADQAAATRGELLVAVAAGYEAGARISDAMVPVDTSANHALRGGWGPGSPLAATIAAARLLALDARRTAHALGLAGMHVDPPPLQWGHVQPAPMAKSADAGWHALTGVAAASMAGLGTTGYDAILDGDRGLWRALGYGGCDADALVGGLGDRWRVLDAAFKAWPVQYWMHPPLTALATALERTAAAGTPIDPAAIDAIVLETNPKSHGPMAREPHPATEVERAFSLPHAAAMLALGIRPSEWLEDRHDADAAVRRLRDRVEVRLHPDAARLDEWVVDHGYRDLPARATITIQDRTIAADARLGRGAPWSPETRLDDEALVAKARDLALAAIRDDPSARERLDRALAWLLDADPDVPVAELVDLLTDLVPTQHDQEVP